MTDFAIGSSRWVWSRRVALLEWIKTSRWALALSSVLVAGLTVSLLGISQNPVPFDDEGTYLAQAWAVMARGDLSHYTYWYDHPPLGWLLIVPWMWITQGFDAESVLMTGRLLMVVLATGSSFLVYVCSRRIGMRRPFALVAVVLFTFSPLGVHFHRMVLLDNVAVLLFLGSTALLLTPDRRMWVQQTGVLMFGLTVLTKETMLLLAPVTFLLLWQGAGANNRRYSLTLGISLLATVVMFYPIMAALKGELLPGEGHVSLFEAVRWQLFDRPAGPSILDPAGSTRAIVNGWLDLDIWLPVLGLLALPVGLFISRLRPFAVGLVAVVLTLFRPGYLPYMFVICALPLLSVMAAGTLDVAWAGRRGRHSKDQNTWVIQIARPILIAIALPVLVFGVGPAWAAGIQEKATADMAESFQDAETWIVENVPPGTPILVDNVLWIELVARGYPTSQTVWYYKLDLDSAVANVYPNGWRDFRYIVSTPGMRATAQDLPNIKQALGNSTTLDTFALDNDSGDDVAIEIRAIDTSTP